MKTAHFTEVSKQIILLLVSLAVSFSTTYITTSWPVPDQYLFAALTFTILVLLDVLFVMAINAGHQIGDFGLWTLCDKGDTLISNIRAHFHKITRDSRGDKDLFLTHFEREFIRLERAIAEVADKGELRVSSHHFVDTDTVVKSFISESNPIWRTTWVLETDDKLFSDLASRRYFEQMIKLLESEQVKEIRIIFVVENLSILPYPRISKILDFIKTNAGCACNIIKHDDYRKLCQDNDVGPQYIDVGIYGNSLLFLTEQYEPATVGVFTRDPDRIAHMQKHFDAIWGSSAVTSENPSVATSKLSVRDLFAFDDAEPIEWDKGNEQTQS